MDHQHVDTNVATKEAENYFYRSHKISIHSSSISISTFLSVIQNQVRAFWQFDFLLKITVEEKNCRRYFFFVRGILHEFYRI